MPCYSVIEHTNMTDLDQIEAACRAEGAQVNRQGDRLTASWADGSRLTFRRRGNSYSAEAAGNTRSQGERSQRALGQIKRKYSELGVRKWAKTKGYGVKQKGRQLTLTRY